MLIKLENGHNGNIVVKTALDLDNATLRIRKIRALTTALNSLRRIFTGSFIRKRFQLGDVVDRA